MPSRTTAGPAHAGALSARPSRPAPPRGLSALRNALWLGCATLALALLCAADATAPSVKLARLVGTVEVSHAKDTGGKWQAASKGQVIGNGWKLRTGKKSKVQIVLPLDNVIILKENSVLTVDKLSADGGGKVKQESGGALFDLKRALSAGSSFEVETPSALATVRGTSFGILLGGSGGSDEQAEAGGYGAEGSRVKWSRQNAARSAEGGTEGDSVEVGDPDSDDDGLGDAQAKGGGVKHTTEPIEWVTGEPGSEGAKGKGELQGAQTNPLYTDEGRSGTNPLYEEQKNQGENPLFEEGRQGATTPPFTVGNDPPALPCDLDGDGKSDFVVCDLNGDGLPDLIVGGASAREVSPGRLVAIGTARDRFGNLADADSDGKPDGAAAIGDLDRDGRPDLVLLGAEAGKRFGMGGETQPEAPLGTAGKQLGALAKEDYIDSIARRSNISKADASSKLDKALEWFGHELAEGEPLTLEQLVEAGPFEEGFWDQDPYAEDGFWDQSPTVEEFLAGKPFTLDGTRSQDDEVARHGVATGAGAAAGAAKTEGDSTEVGGSAGMSIDEPGTEKLKGSSSADSPPPGGPVPIPYPNTAKFFGYEGQVDVESEGRKQALTGGMQIEQGPDGTLYPPNPCGPEAYAFLWDAMQDLGLSDFGMGRISEFDQQVLALIAEGQALKKEEGGRHTPFHNKAIEDGEEDDTDAAGKQKQGSTFGEKVNQGMASAGRTTQNSSFGEMVRKLAQEEADYLESEDTFSLKALRDILGPLYDVLARAGAKVRLGAGGGLLALPAVQKGSSGAKGPGSEGSGGPKQLPDPELAGPGSEGSGTPKELPLEDFAGPGGDGAGGGGSASSKKGYDYYQAQSALQSTGSAERGYEKEPGKLEIPNLSLGDLDGDGLSDSLNSVGDVDGDGVGDYRIVYSPPSSGKIASSDGIAARGGGGGGASGTAESNLAAVLNGKVVVGDLNGDGRADISLGDLDGDGLDDLGVNVGDLNGDGCPDFIVGLPGGGSSDDGVIRDFSWTQAEGPLAGAAEGSKIGEKSTAEEQMQGKPRNRGASGGGDGDSGEGGDGQGGIDIFTPIGPGGWLIGDGLDAPADATGQSGGMDQSHRLTRGKKSKTYQKMGDADLVNAARCNVPVGDLDGDGAMDFIMCSAKLGAANGGVEAPGGGDAATAIKDRTELKEEFKTGDIPDQDELTGGGGAGGLGGGAALVGGALPGGSVLSRLQEGLGGYNLGDVDGDGAPDLLVLSFSEDIEFAAGKGTEGGNENWDFEGGALKTKHDTVKNAIQNVRAHEGGGGGESAKIKRELEIERERKGGLSIAVPEGDGGGTGPAAYTGGGGKAQGVMGAKAKAWMVNNYLLQPAGDLDGDGLEDYFVDGEDCDDADPDTGPDDAARAQFNPKEVGIDKSVTWNKRTGTEGSGGTDPIESREILKTYFETGDKPTAQQFAALLDSCLAAGDLNGDGSMDYFLPSSRMSSQTGGTPLFRDGIRITKGQEGGGGGTALFRDGIRITKGQGEKLDGNTLFRDGLRRSQGVGDPDFDFSAVGDLDRDGLDDFVILGSPRTDSRRRGDVKYEDVQVKKEWDLASSGLQNEGLDPSDADPDGDAAGAARKAGEIKAADFDYKAQARRNQEQDNQDIAGKLGALLGADADGDGAPDWRDDDCDGDGLAERCLGDLDGDGALDYAVAGGDLTGDGLEDFLVLSGAGGDLRAAHGNAMNSIRNLKGLMSGGPGGGGEGETDQRGRDTGKNSVRNLKGVSAPGGGADEELARLIELLLADSDGDGVIDYLEDPYFGAGNPDPAAHEIPVPYPNPGSGGTNPTLPGHPLPSGPKPTTGDEPGTAHRAAGGKFTRHTGDEAGTLKESLKSQSGGGLLKIGDFDGDSVEDLAVLSSLQPLGGALHVHGDPHVDQRGAAGQEHGDPDRPVGAAGFEHGDIRHPYLAGGPDNSASGEPAGEPNDVNARALGGPGNFGATPGLSGGDMLAIGDLDGDGLEDFAYLSSAEFVDGRYILRAGVPLRVDPATGRIDEEDLLGLKTFVLPHVLEASGLAVGDLDGDGRPDLLVSGALAGRGGRCGLADGDEDGLPDCLDDDDDGDGVPTVEENLVSAPASGFVRIRDTDESPDDGAAKGGSSVVGGQVTEILGRQIQARGHRDVGGYRAGHTDEPTNIRVDFEAAATDTDGDGLLDFVSGADLGPEFKALLEGDPLKEESHFKEAQGLDVDVDALEIQEGGRNTGAHKQAGSTRIGSAAPKSYDEFAALIDEHVAHWEALLALLEPESPPNADLDNLRERINELEAKLKALGLLNSRRKEEGPRGTILDLLAEYARLAAIAEELDALVSGDPDFDLGKAAGPGDDEDCDGILEACATWLSAAMDGGKAKNKGKKAEKKAEQTTAKQGNRASTMGDAISRATEQLARAGAKVKVEIQQELVLTRTALGEADGRVSGHRHVVQYNESELDFILARARDYFDEWERYSRGGEQAQLLLLYNEFLKLDGKALKAARDATSLWRALDAVIGSEYAADFGAAPPVLQPDGLPTERTSIKDGWNMLGAFDTNADGRLPEVEDEVLVSLETGAGLEELAAQWDELIEILCLVEEDAGPLVEDRRDLLGKLRGALPPGNPVLGIRNLNLDTDNDGLPDGVEILLGLNPSGGGPEGGLELVSPDDGDEVDVFQQNETDFEFVALDTDAVERYDLVLEAGGQRWVRKDVDEVETVNLLPLLSQSGPFAGILVDGLGEIEWHVEAVLDPGVLGVVPGFDGTLSSESRVLQVLFGEPQDGVIIDLTAAGPASVQPGQQLRVRGSVSEITALGQWQIRIAYDDGLLQFTQGARLGIFSGSTVFFSVGGGVLTVSGAAPGGAAVTGEGDIFELTFTANEAGDSIIEGDSVELLDQLGNVIDADFGESVEVTVSGGGGGGGAASIQKR